MEREFELIGAGAMGALLKRKAKHAPEPGALCPNCGTELQGFYCHVCGQSHHDAHRSIWHLMWEGIEGFTHLDGRLGQTLPPLFFNPGKLARDHLEGRRARHVPPFRLFLISLLIFMFVLEALFNGHTGENHTVVHGKTVAVVNGKVTTNVVFATPDQLKTMVAADKAKDAAGTKPPTPPVAVVFATPQQARALLTPDRAKAPNPVPPVARPAPAPPIAGPSITIGPPAPKTIASFKVDGQDAEASSAAEALDKTGKGSKDPLGRWLEEHIKRAAANKDYYGMVLFTWAHRLAILLLPILAGLLALVYVRRRKQFYIYDHLIVAMQFLSFEFLVFAIAWVIPDPLRQWAVLIATIWTPVNLYMILRGAYGSRWFTAGIKTLFLWLSTLFLFGLLMTGLMTLALAEM